MQLPHKKSWKKTLSRWFTRGLLALCLLCVVGVLLVIFWPTNARTIKPLATYLRCPCPLILAHQGASGHAPSNTLPSFHLAKTMKADILEMDVHLTSDQRVVVAHDAKLHKKTNGTGPLKDKTLSQLQQLDAGYHFTKDGTTYPYRGKGIRIPTLDRVFRTFPNTRMNIEVKVNNPTLDAKVWNLINKYNAQKRVLICSFHHGALLRWARKYPSIPTSASPFQILRFTMLWKLGLGRLWTPEAHAFQIPPLRGVLSQQPIIKFAQDKGVSMHYWTVNDIPTMRQLVRNGAQGIITDYPDRAYQVIQEFRKNQKP